MLCPLLLSFRSMFRLQGLAHDKFMFERVHVFWIWISGHLEGRAKLFSILFKKVLKVCFFGAGMGKVDGHYCDVLSCSINLSLVERRRFLFHWPVSYCLRFRKPS